MRSGFSMRAKASRLACRQGRVFENGCGAVCERSMMYELGEIGTVLHQRRKHPVVHCACAVRRERTLDRKTCKLMAKAHSVALRRE
jgi:hypothetical protein